MADIIWTKVQVILTDVPIEYMDCNSDAFADGDEVIVEFTGQDWEQPKIIGFEESPRVCKSVYIFPGQSQRYDEPNGSRTMKLNYLGNSWSWKAKFPRTYYFPPDITGSGDRLGYAATGENGIGLTLGGNSIADAGPTEQYFSDLDLFDSTTESFSIGNDSPIEKTDGCFESLKNGRCISHGGRTAITVRHQTHQYAMTNNSWSRLKSGQQIFDHASFVIDGNIYTVCGSIYQQQGLISYLRGHGTQQSTQTQMYNNIDDSWKVRTTCPKNDWTNLNGYNLENKGLVGGGGQVYKDGEQGWDSSNETYLYDASTYSWTKKGNGYNSYGTQATSTALDEQVALQFSGAVTGVSSPGLTQWFDYKIGTDTWRNRGNFELTVNDDPIWYSHRRGAAGAEL